MASKTKPWRNWAGNQVCLPAERAQPRSTDEVAGGVARAHAAGQRVKVFGAGHSFTAAACTDGVLLSLDHLDTVESVDRQHHRVTVGAGIRLHALNERLAELGLAMPNLGDIAYQSIAGAIATATHGTGARLGNLATAVAGIELVTGTGEVIWCDEHVRRHLWTAARVGVGALGIVTKVTLQCVPAFNLHAVETKEPLDDLIDNFDDEADGNDHFEFFWMPGARNCQVKRNNRTDRPEAPPSRVSYVREKIVGENLAFGLVNRVSRRSPTLAPRVAKLVSAGVSERELIDRSYRVFASPRLVKFTEMEYGLPRAALPEALHRVRDVVARLGEPITFPVEVRVSAADDIPLSTAEGRDSAWLAFHVYQGTSHESYFTGVEAILDDYDARPHWGKLHTQNHRTLRPRYPR
ncbi:MAG: FAD-binding protein, partial [Acidimicrobiia bacterium]|nr:FAD-binding protein [Acidimicrobiia bacterium]